MEENKKEEVKLKRKFKELTEEEIQSIKDAYYNKENSWDENVISLVNTFNVGERTIRRWYVKLGLKHKTEKVSQEYIDATKRKTNKKAKRFIISWAQNNTDVHDKFLDNLERYAEFIGADVHIIAGRYKNPTSVFTDKDYEFWHERVNPYLDAARHDVHKYVSILSDVKIQPTAVNPMLGMQGMSGINSCVFGSPKVQREQIPVLEGNRPKTMFTTGACTLKNYTDSKAGKKGEFHHTLGFVIVEIKDKENAFIRQVTATDDGDFIDLFYQVKHGKEITKIDKISALIWGDLHYGHHDEVVFESTFKLMEKLAPKNVVLHDVFDGYSINHHDIKDPFAQFRKEINNQNSLKLEVENLMTALKRFEKYKTIIVRSNHDDFIDRWLVNTDWRKTVTPKNSIEYMEYSLALLNDDAKQGIIPYLINKRFPDFITLDRDSSYKVKGWELGQHGDIGTNGSRGSAEQYRKLNTKIVVGHYHAPMRKDGVLAVGTTTKLRVGYNIGPSSWLHSHVLIHKDGKAQHIDFVDGEYTTFE